MKIPFRAESSRINDPGFGEKIGGPARRIINPDGSFNVSRKGAERGLRSVYQYLLFLSNLEFFIFLLVCYVVINLVFAALYFVAGPENLSGLQGETPLSHFADCFYFSTQTFTTVGYGAIAPRGILVSTIASFEALLGLLAFAIATGLLFARFSKPRAFLKYSRKAVIAPYRDGRALMFRLANRRTNVLMDMHARVIMVMQASKEDRLNRQYYELKLEIANVLFVPLSWTLVHRLDDNSPLSGLTPQEMEELNLEIMVLITAYDDTFNQVVHSRFSYLGSEIEDGAKFMKAFSVDPSGEVVLDLERIDAYEKV